MVNNIVEIEAYTLAKVRGSTEIWTRIAGIRVLSADHYTMEPSYNLDIGLEVILFYFLDDILCLSTEEVHPEIKLKFNLSPKICKG